MRKNSPHKSIGWILSLCFVGLITGCVGMNANTLKPMPRGEVVDEETGKPISGAYVLVQYIGDSGAIMIADPGALPSDECYGSLVAKTDEAGRFDFSSQGRKKPVSMKFPKNQRMEITAYKPGYTMEDSEGYQSYLDRELIMVRFEPVSIGKVRLEMTPQEKSRFEERHEYLLDVIRDRSCDGYSADNWEMEYAMLEEAKQSAGTLDEWGYTYALCNRINQYNEDENLGHTVLDCSVYNENITRIKREHFERTITDIENIDWSGLPKLELIEFKFVGDLERHTAAYSLSPPLHEINATIAMKLLKRLCTAGSKKIEKGSICILNEKGGGQWNEERWEACDIQYGRLWPSDESRLLLRIDGVMKQVLSLSPGWCDR
ncbi:MAG: hypothetical protein KZQ85_13355 [Candidatus Thiodiazotropha sp. (ex Myrtea sp. 'scaly one' KF741663)]|nr:hypothetical protein [Candidatus Thiodiazotropha sp. (ex Myrtea sp. 'scaly one' KF741663)]